MKIQSIKSERKDKEKALIQELKRRGIYGTLEPEFCIIKEYYLMLFSEETGELWDQRHGSEIGIFHNLFLSYWGKLYLAYEIKSYAESLTMENRKAFWGEAFDKNDFTDEEYLFIQKEIEKIASGS